MKMMMMMIIANIKLKIAIFKETELIAEFLRD